MAYLPVGFNRDRGDLTGTEREGKRRRERGSGVEREERGSYCGEREWKWWKLLWEREWLSERGSGFN